MYESEINNNNLLHSSLKNNNVNNNLMNKSNLSAFNQSNT